MYTGRARRIPLIRGTVVLWETMALGMRALQFSSQVALEEEDEDGEVAEFPEKAFWGTMVVALAFVIGIFFAAPILLANLLEMVDASRLVIVLVEAAVRLGFFVGYIALIGLMPDIRRVFQYHGAEHMTIHAYEAKRPLTVAGVRPFAKEHTRCGTSFLLVVVMVALLTFLVFDLLVDEGLIRADGVAAGVHRADCFGELRDLAAGGAVRGVVVHADAVQAEHPASGADDEGAGGRPDRGGRSRVLRATLEAAGQGSDH